MTVTIALSCIAVLLALACWPWLIGRPPVAHYVVYGASLAASLRLLGAALHDLLSAAAPVRDTCRSGCRGSARISASMRCRRSSWSWSISAPRRRACSRSATGGTSKRRSACCRSIRPFLAGMNLVVLADDAFTFLVSWEFMSLTSWALVMAHHRVRDNVHAGYVYLRDGELRHARAAARLRPARRPRRRLCLRGHPRRASVRRPSPRWC